MKMKGMQVDISTLYPVHSLHVYMLLYSVAIGICCVAGAVCVHIAYKKID